MRPGLRIALLAAVPWAAYGQVDFLGIPPSPASGELGDAQCNIAEVEEANESQLHALLVELSETTFFRMIKARRASASAHIRPPPRDARSRRRTRRTPRLRAVPHARRCR